MNGAGTFLSLYEFGAAAALLFLVAVFLQRMRMQHMERELDQITLKFQQQAVAPKTITHELFDDCPYPMCSVDTKGEVLAFNRAFEKLTRNTISHISQFDAQFSTQLHTLLTKKPSQKQIVLRMAGVEKERRFHVVSWPIMGTHMQAGTMLAFHEQTFVAERRQSQSHFESQLVEYMSFIGGEIDRVIRGGGSETTKLIHAYSEEMSLLSEHASSVHGQIRERGDHQKIDIGLISKRLIDMHRADWRRRSIHLVSSFPVKVRVLGQEEDIVLALKTMFSGILMLAEDGDELSYSIHRERGRVQIEWSLPNTKMSEADVATPFAFGKSDKNISADSRAWRLHMTIARELFAKFNGTLEVSYVPSFGVKYTATLVADSTK